MVNFLGDNVSGCKSFRVQKFPGGNVSGENVSGENVSLYHFCPPAGCDRFAGLHTIHSTVAV